MQRDLQKKSVKGVVWNLLENASSYLIRFTIGIILARLLTPADYGLIGMTVIFFSIAEVLVNSGFGQAFIQKKDADEKDANTVFLTNFIISLLIYFVLWISAPFIATFFNQVILTKLIRVMSIVVVINSLNIIQLAIIRKNLEFKKKTLLTFGSSIASGIIGIVCAYKGLSVWSLVVQQVSNRLFVCIGLYLTSRWQLRFSFSYSSFKTMFSYGSWLLLTNITIKIFDNLYRFVIGKFFPASDLGFYDRGHQFPSMIYQQFSWSVGAVAFPVYSKLQGNNIELEHSLGRFVKYSSFITLPLLAALFIVADPFVRILLTDKWAGAIPYIKLYCLIGMVVPIYNFLTQYIEAIGHTKANFRFTLILNFFRIINIIINIKTSIVAILVGELIIRITALVLISAFSKKIIGFSFFKTILTLRTLLYSLLLSLACGLIISELLKSNLYINFFASSLITITTYIVTLYYIDRNVVEGVIKFLKRK
jgi:O-antigen/teichoic acid export membrane protein